jgi:pimeloyl-ACP methyl ester carboxylesterase
MLNLRCGGQPSIPRIARACAAARLVCCRPPGALPGGAAEKKQVEHAIEELELRVAGLSFDAVAAGPADGELVLLCHGFPQTKHAWHRLLPVLAAAGYRAVAADGRGISPGARPQSVEAYEIEHLVADVIGFADALGAERFHFVGHDWGGFQGWQTASRHPERLLTLNVLSTPHNSALRRACKEGSGDQVARSAYFEIFRTPGAGEDMWIGNGREGLRQLYAAAGLDAEEAEPYVEVFGERAALTGMLNWYRAGEPTWDRGLGRIRVPTLYCWGSEDPALGREAAEWTADWIDGPYRFEVFEGAGHWLPEQGGARLEAVLLDHLRGGALSR